MKVVCPHCASRTVSGAFCERCGKALPPPATEMETARGFASSVTPPPETPPPSSFTPPSPPPSSGAQTQAQAPRETYGARFDEAWQDVPFSRPAADRGKPSLKVDRLCVQFDGYSGLVRFLFEPGSARGGLENLRFRFENQLTGATVESRAIRFLDSTREIPVVFPVQQAGAAVWSVTVEYESAGRRRLLEGDVQMVVVHPREAQSIAGSLAINITNNITNGHASDVHVSQRAVDELAKLQTAENPFDELRRIVSGPARSWGDVELFEPEGAEQMPPMPPAARTEKLTLDFGVRRITFFAGRTLLFGRTKELNHIALRPPPDAGETRLLPYRMISRAHCHFEHQGAAVMVCDGQRDERHVLRASAGGTFWNGSRLEGPVMLESGTSGVVSFAGTAAEGALSLDVKVCAASGSCSGCPYGNRHWCGDGKRPSLMLSRRDGIVERFVSVWSCFPLGEADPSFEGVTIFRKDGAFAWRKGRRCGWIVPGTEQQTDFGVVTVT